MANRTQIVCLHEGKKGRSIDPVFIYALMNALAPPWIRPGKGSNLIRPVDGGGRKSLIQKMPDELKICLRAGAKTTLMVWADLDHDMENGDQLREQFWKEAEKAKIKKEEFDQVVFVFAKDRLENWIQYLRDGATNELEEGPRIRHNSEARDAARELANRCRQPLSGPNLPVSLVWSCKNWHQLVDRMVNE